MQNLTTLIPSGFDPCEGQGVGFNELVVPTFDPWLTPPPCDGSMPGPIAVTLPDCSHDFVFDLDGTDRAFYMSVAGPMAVTFVNKPHPWRFPSAEPTDILVVVGNLDCELLDDFWNYDPNIPNFRLTAWFPAAGDYLVEIAALGVAGWIVVEMHQESPAGFLPHCGFSGALKMFPRTGERPRFSGSYCTTDLIIPYPALGQVMLVGIEKTPVVDLAPIGLAGCRLGHNVIVSEPLTVVGLAEAEFGIELGFWPGLTFYLQAAAIEFGATALNVVLSERLEWTIGDEPESRFDLPIVPAK